MKGLLHNRALMIVGVAEAISNIGNWITMLAVFALVVFRGGGGVAQTSGIMLAGLGPMLIASPLAGWVCDRFDRKWLMVASELLSALAVTGLVFTDSLPLIYALLAVQSVVGSLILPARQVAVRHVVADADLTRANAFLQQLAGTIKIGGPILGGMILSIMSPHSAMVLDIISFVIAALLLSTLPSLPPQATQAEPEHPTAKTQPATRSFLAVMREGALLRLLFLAAFMLVVVIMGFDVLSAVFTRDVLRGDEGLFGLLIGAVGLGTVVAAVTLMFRARDSDPWHDLIAGLLLLGAIPASLAIATLIGDARLAQLAVGAGCLIGGFGNGLITIQSSTLLQRLSPPELLGRMGGMFQSAIVAGQLLSIFATPLLVPAILSPGAYFACGAVALAILALFTLLTLRSNRQRANGAERSQLTPQL